MMYIQRLNLVKLNSLILACCCSLVAGHVFALSTDKQQNIEIEADSADIDDLKGITVYKGNVIVVQGSIRMTGHTMTVNFDDNGDMELVIMQGNPATYRQLPDNSKIYDEAEALQMEYYALKDYVILIDKAIVTQKDSKMSGKRIEYDTIKSRVIAKGGVETDKKSPDNETKSDGRVRVTIKKKKEE